MSFACAFMILNIVLMLVSCFKTDFKGCMSLLHSELILACWVKILHIRVFANLLSCWLPILSWSYELSYIRGRMFPRGRYCNTPYLEIRARVKISNFWKIVVNCHYAKRPPRRAVLLKTARERCRPGDLFQSPGEWTKTDGITSRSPQNGALSFPCHCLQNMSFRCPKTPNQYEPYSAPRVVMVLVVSPSRVPSEFLKIDF